MIIEGFELSSAALMGGTTAGQTIVPIDQSRSVSNEQVNAPQCSGDFLFDGEAPIRFEPFDAFVQTEHNCDSGAAAATAGQQSQIDPGSRAPAPSSACVSLPPPGGGSRDC